MKAKLIRIALLIAGGVLLLLAPSCATSTNNQPIITGLELGAEGVAPLGTVQVVCIASDPDGDELSYAWSATAGQIEGAADTATWIAPASEGSYSVAVEVTDGRGGEVTDHVAITVRTNNHPNIVSLTADAESTTPSGSIQLACTASDPDGDALSYDWSASGGDISGTGPVVSWTAPQQTGTYDVTVTVTDGYGGEAIRSVSLGVIVGTLPTIEQLCIAPEGHIFLRESAGVHDFDVWKGKEYQIECVVSDPSGVASYEWTCTGGSISGDGSLIIWTAPDDLSVAVTVTVTVRNALDDEANETMNLWVPSCTCGSWGLGSGCK